MGFVQKFLFLVTYFFEMRHLDPDPKTSFF